jgi:hypothetical protein
MSKRGLHPYKRLALTTLTALIGLGGAAQADIHAAGPVYGGSNPSQVGGSISCRVFNFGAVSVSIPTRQIFDSNNVPVTPTVYQCGLPLAVGQTCTYAAPITSLLAYSCRVIDTSTGSTSLSGAAEIQSSTGEVLSVLPLVH